MAEESKPVKKSFVSPDDAVPEEQKKVEKEILRPEISLMLIYGKASKAVELLEELVGIFRSASPVSAPVPTPVETPVQKPVEVPVPMTQVEKPTVSSPVQERLIEIQQALSEFTEKDIRIEPDTDAMFFIVRPNGYLGNDVFRKINDVIRVEPIKGIYVSQSKTSHWKIPKAKPS